MAYNSETGTHTAIVFIPMQQTGTIAQPKVHSKNTQNGQPQKPQIQRTYRQKPYNYIKLMILDDEESQEIVDEQEDKKEERKLTKHRRNQLNKKPEIPDSALRRNMHPYTRNGNVTLRIRKVHETVPHNILTLPEYQQRKKEILRSGVQPQKNNRTFWLPKNCITQFDNAVRMNGAEIFAELNFNPTR